MPPFEQAPEALKAVRVYAPIYKLRCVVNNLMRVVRCQPIVGHERIAVEGRASSDMLAYFLLQYGLATAGNDRSANFAATLQNAHNGGFVFSARSSKTALALTQVHVACFTADESLIDFDFAAEFGPEEFILHRKANPLEHEPCRLLANANIPRNLVTGNAVLTVSKHPSCREPFIQRNRAILVERTDLDRELPLGMVAAALPSAPLRVEANLRCPATGTDNAVRPSPDSNVVDAVVGTREVDNRFLKALGFLFHD